MLTSNSGFSSWVENAPRMYKRLEREKSLPLRGRIDVRRYSFSWSVKYANWSLFSISRKSIRKLLSSKNYWLMRSLYQKWVYKSTLLHKINNMQQQKSDEVVDFRKFFAKCSFFFPGREGGSGRPRCGLRVGNWRCRFRKCWMEHSSLFNAAAYCWFIWYVLIYEYIYLDQGQFDT